MDYLLKPIDPDELMSAVKKVQEQRHLPMAEQFQMLLKKINEKEHHFNKIAVPTFEGFELVPADHVIHCEEMITIHISILKIKIKLLPVVLSKKWRSNYRTLISLFVCIIPIW